MNRGIPCQSFIKSPASSDIFGLIKERKEGKWCLYRISDGTVMDMVNLARLFKRK